VRFDSVEFAALATDKAQSFLWREEYQPRNGELGVVGGAARTTVSDSNLREIVLAEE
jgi:hypothetical protein